MTPSPPATPGVPPPQQDAQTLPQSALPEPPAPAVRPLARLDPSYALILADWQAEVQFAVEAGMAPALAVGGSASVTNSLVGLEAVRLLLEQRRDMTSPVAAAGGTSGAWLNVLLQPQSGQAAHAPALVALFAGADEATQIAAAGTLPGVPARLAPPGNRGLPNGFRPHVAPVLQPAAPPMWENLPFRVLEPAPTPFGAQPAGTLAGWLALLFVALLIFGALAL